MTYNVFKMKILQKFSFFCEKWDKFYKFNFKIIIFVDCYHATRQVLLFCPFCLMEKMMNKLDIMCFNGRMK